MSQRACHRCIPPQDSGRTRGSGALAEAIAGQYRRIRDGHHRYRAFEDVTYGRSSLAFMDHVHERPSEDRRGDLDERPDPAADRPRVTRFHPFPAVPSNGGEAAMVSIFDSGCCYTRSRFGDASRRRRHPYQRVIPVLESVAAG